MAPPNGPRQVFVDVDVCEPQGYICKPDPAPATPNHIRTQFVFRLSDPSNWRWANNSPVVVNNPPPSQFPTPSSINPGNGHAHLDDENSDSNRYQYTVTIVHKTTGQQIQIDPIIQNQ